jgi:hypothetical protein
MMSRLHFLRKRAKRLIFLSVASAVFLGNVSASPISYSFTGTLSQTYSQNAGGLGVWDGQEITGNLAFDPASQPITQTDGYSILWQQKLTGTYFGTPYAAPYVSLTLRLPNGDTLSNSGQTASQSETMVLRNWSNQNKISFAVSSRDDVWQSGTQLYRNYLSVTIQLYDFNATSSTLFPDASGGLRYDQPLNLEAAGQTAYFSFVNKDLSAGPPNYYTANDSGNFTITSLTLNAPVPEPESYALMLLGLIFVLGRAKQKKIKKTCSGVNALPSRCRASISINLVQ